MPERRKNYHRLFSFESREGGGAGEENQLPLLDGVGGRVPALEEVWPGQDGPCVQWEPSEKDACLGVWGRVQGLV